MSDSDSSSSSSSSGSSSSGSSRSSSASSKSSKSSTSKSSKSSRTSQSSKSSRGSRTGVELTRGKKNVKEDSSDSEEDVELRTGKTRVKEEEESENSGIRSKPAIGSDDSEFELRKMKSKPEESGESESDKEMHRKKMVEESDSEIVQKRSAIPPSVMVRLDAGLASGKAKSESESEFSSDADRGDSRISMSTHEQELTRGKSKKVEESGTSASSASESSSSESDTDSDTSSSSRTTSNSGTSSATSTSRTTSNTTTSNTTTSNTSTSSITTSSSRSSSLRSKSSVSTHSDVTSDSSSSSSSDSDSDSDTTSGSSRSRSTRSSRSSMSSKSSKASQKSAPKATKAIETSDVKVTLNDNKEVPPEDQDKWVKFGVSADNFFFSRYFLPIFGTISILLVVIFSIVIDCRLSGRLSIPYGASFIPLMVAFIMWAILIIIAALSRVRYAANIAKPPSRSDFFDSRWANKEGVRIAMFVCVSFALIMGVIFLILASVKVDGHVKSFHSWRNPFIALWIMLGFIALAVLFSWRFMHGFMNILTHIVVTAGLTALTIAIYLKANGHLSDSVVWYKVLVPLWLLDFFFLLLILWHVLVRTVCHAALHPTGALRKNTKKAQQEPTMADKFASVPLGVSVVFFLLFQVVIVAHTEGVFKNKYQVSWSFVWIWFWLSCFFLMVWTWTFRYDSIDRKEDKKQKEMEV